jgi:hypothetical protein
MIFITSCDKSLSVDQKINIDHLIVRSLPIFPVPSITVVDELKEVCPEDKCIALHEWLGRLVVLEKQLALYEKLELNDRP